MKEKYDTLLHYATEVKLPYAELIEKAKDLFPKFSNTAIYDEVIGSYEIEVYMQGRSMGLSVEDAAYSAELTHTTMKHALEGYGVSIEKFTHLIKAELFAESTMVRKLLTIVEKAENNTSVNAAIALLEKIAPQKYGKGVGLAANQKDSEGKPVVLNFSLYDPDE